MRSVRRWVLAAALSALLFSAAAEPAAVPYDDYTTHVALITQAIHLAAPGGYPELLAYKEAIKKGAVEEDSGSPIMRFAQHFFDPDGGLGMPRNSYTIVYGEGRLPSFGSSTRYPSAYDWGLNGMPDHLDWEGAIAAYGYGQNDQAYLALGHVAHLLQDMAQPDHATCRPHPGGEYAKEFITTGPFSGARKQVADYLFPDSRISFEGLWKIKNAEWPRGKVVQKVGDLKDAFSTLASKAKDKQQYLHPLQTVERGERALGLRSYRSARADPGGQGREAIGEVLTVALDAFAQAWRMEQYLDFKDDQWLEFEMYVPIVPMIPWPANQETQSYIDLGNALLPLAEEWSAGLLQHFHDIVNHPPIVQAVEIFQGGVRQYQKSWVDGLTGRNLVSGADTGVSLGAEVEIRITFGPEQKNRDLAEPITDIKVFLELDGGEALPISGQVVSGTGEPILWVGSIIPQKFGTLRIEAKDGHAHFEGREHKGDLLDSNPGSYALARPPAPYNWVGYEPGPDRNHRLSAGTACGVCAAVGRNEKTFVSGTYKGTVSRKYENAEGRLAETQAQVTFRCLRVGYSWNRTQQKNDLILGIGSGTYTCRFRAWTARPVETFTGGTIHVGGAVSISEPCTGQGHKYIIGVDFPGVPYNLQFGAEGIVQNGLSLSGQHTNDAGARYAWNLVFSPAPAPPHLAAGGTLDPGMLSGYLSGYSKQAWDVVTPGYTRLAIAGRTAEIKRLQDRMAEPTNAMVQEEPVWNRLSIDVLDRYKEAERAWIYLDPKDNPEEKYRAAVPALATAVSQWKAAKKGIEDKYGAATLDVARMIEPVDKDGSQKLRALVEKLMTQGSEAFGDTQR